MVNAVSSPPNLLLFGHSKSICCFSSSLGYECGRAAFLVRNDPQITSLAHPIIEAVSLYIFADTDANTNIMWRLETTN